jgi:hypothetical protein
MCTYEDDIEIEIIQKIRVDRCIAKEIQWLNAQGIRTEGCCCGHGKSYPEALIKPSSIFKAKELGYIPIPYPNSEYFEIELKSDEAHKCPVKENSLTG